ncbi:hypothetical protein FOZ63_032430 [Perkinsus olseni]|uniref:Uncharacterized protein n=1 Tax=Perkinsus olseni TaxID=32597 RepID=A0A7J6QCU8_PEROL|nr:hypothetical protein FOZ63_032430 [Perkinsus olseni]
MKSPSHVTALELRLFETLLEGRGRVVAPPELVGEVALFLGTRPCTLDCPREEVLVNPPPSYIFVMNEDLCGVYPTPTGVYIRKPLEGGEEVMVLQPGFQGTKAVYYYHNNKSQLFVLCERNRRLIVYSLSTGGRKQGHVVRVLGLPRAVRSITDMVSHGPFLFVLLSRGHLFCIDQSHLTTTVQAKLVWSNSFSGRSEGLLVDPREPEWVNVLVRGDHEIFKVRLRMESRRAPLYFQPLMVDMEPITDDEPGGPRLVAVRPVDHRLFALVLRRLEDSEPRDCWVEICDRDFETVMDECKVSQEYTEGRYMQIVSSGHGDVVYILRDDTSFSPPYSREWSSDSDDSSERSSEFDDEGAIRRLYFGCPRRISAYYVYACN